MSSLPAAPALTARALGVRHDSAGPWRPESLDLTVEPGQVVALLGPSGSGKSSAALALAGLAPGTVPTEVRGTVAVADGGRVAIVLQDPDAQIVTRTVHDEVCFGPANLCLPVDEVRARARTALENVDLWDRRDADPAALSGGERQRLVVAACLALHPRVIVLDEPTANLDAAATAELYVVLSAAVRGQGSALILIEHDLGACAELVDHVVVLDKHGQVALAGPFDAVIRGAAAQVRDLGVWLPIPTMAALRLQAAGLKVAPLPVTSAELAALLDQREELPPLADDGDGSVSWPMDAPADAPSSTAASSTAPRSAAGGAPALAVTHLSWQASGRAILTDISLTVERGDYLAIVGRSGAGKTTLVQAMAGVTRPPRGTVWIDGTDLTRMPARAVASEVGFVFQNPEHQFLCETVADELALGLMRHLGRAETDRRVAQVADLLDLTDLMDRHPFTLSGGQKRRLSVATALVAGARTLIFDEPTYGQDLDRATHLLDLIDTLHAAGTTIVMVTHDLQAVADRATRVAVLDGGRLVAHGPTREIFAGPVLERAGLGVPPLADAMRRLRRHPQWQRVIRLADLPGADR